MDPDFNIHGLCVRECLSVSQDGYDVERERGIRFERRIIWEVSRRWTLWGRTNHKRIQMLGVVWLSIHFIPDTFCSFGGYKFTCKLMRVPLFKGRGRETWLHSQAPFSIEMIETSLWLPCLSPFCFFMASKLVDHLPRVSCVCVCTRKFMEM